MLEVGGDDLKEWREELDPEEEFSLSVQAPVEKLNQRQEAVGLKHVVPVFPGNAELEENLKDQVENLRQMLQLTLRADLYSLAYVNKVRDEFELAHQMQVACSPLLENTNDVVEDCFHCVVVLDGGENRLLEFNASDLKPVLVGAFELLARIGRRVFMADRSVQDLLFQLFHFSLEGFLFFLFELKGYVARL